MYQFSQSRLLNKGNNNGALSGLLGDIFDTIPCNLPMIEGFNPLMHIYPLKEQLMKIASHLD